MVLGRIMFVCLFFFYYIQFFEVGFFYLKVDSSYWIEISDFKRYFELGLIYELNIVYEFVEINIFVEYIWICILMLIVIF